MGRWLPVLIGASVLAGCATYSSSFSSIERDLSAHQYDVALQNIEKQAARKTDKVLYLLNKGMVLRMKGDWLASNQALEAAKAEMGRLYAASISENTLSFIVNDATVSYAGDNYEQVLVHLYLALNYLQLGQLDEARVEAMQVDVKLREFDEQMDDDQFTEDAFSRYLAGMIYEEQGEWSDALIAYRKAYEAYKKYQNNFGFVMPAMLKNDLLHLAQRQGLVDEVAQYQKEFGIDPPAAADPIRLGKKNSVPRGELVFILNNGLAPIKREQSTSLLDPVSGVWVRIALPYYESRDNNVQLARIKVSNQQVSTELMEDIDAIARKNLESRMPTITARSIARAAVKVTAQKSLSQRSGNNNDAAMADLIGSLAVQVAAVATERADTRSWLTLPANIQLARIPLPAGSYAVQVELLDANEQVVANTDYPEVAISEGRKTYLSEHWIPAPLATVRREK